MQELFERGGFEQLAAFVAVAESAVSMPSYRLAG